MSFMLGGTVLLMIIRKVALCIDENETKRKKTKDILQGMLIFVALLSAFVLGKTVIFPLVRVEEAVGLLDSGNRDEARSILNEIENNGVIECGIYHHAVSYIRSGKNDEAILLLSGLSYKDSEELYTKCCLEQYGSEKTEYIERIHIGDTYLFGAYEQDNNTENGKEMIEWIVLDKEGTRLLLISKYVLDCQQYHTALEDVTWENCSLRKWLNEDFLNNAFNKGQKDYICTTFNTTDYMVKNQVVEYSTYDKIFILKPSEVKKYYGISDSHITREARQCKLTEYARAQGARGWNSYGRHKGPYCDWWLRPTHRRNRWNNAAAISSTGSYCSEPGATDDSGVRPVLWIDLK